VVWGARSGRIFHCGSIGASALENEGKIIAGARGTTRARPVWMGRRSQLQALVSVLSIGAVVVEVVACSPPQSASLGGAGDDDDSSSASASASTSAKKPASTASTASNSSLGGDDDDDDDDATGGSAPGPVTKKGSPLSLPIADAGSPPPTVGNSTTVDPCILQCLSNNVAAVTAYSQKLAAFSTCACGADCGSLCSQSLECTADGSGPQPSQDCVTCATTKCGALLQACQADPSCAQGMQCDEQCHPGS
jgi:hypothetical protein